MTSDVDLNLVLLAAFVAVAGFVFAAGQLYFGGARLRRRLAAGEAALASGAKRAGGGIGALVTETFTEDRFGVDTALRQKLRRELFRAGFFGNDAIRYYVFARFCTVAIAPLAIFALLEFFAPATPFLLTLLAVALAAGIGVLAPDAYLSRRQKRLQDEYRRIFPDMLDLLIICISAGLSMDAALDRVRTQLSKRSAALGHNLELMAAETRAGRSPLDALNSFADRLAIDEASSFATVMRHSSELGGDVVDSLRVYSDEMRDRRMLRAEQKANELPVKMVMPMALGIFPVILLLILLPIMLKLATVFHHG